MSFATFFAAIETPGLREVARHWDAARGDKRMPAWKDLDPLAIAPQLSLIWSWKYDRESDRFTGRLAGEQITAAFGKDLRGADMAEFFAGMHYEAIFARHRRVVVEPCFAHGRGRVFIHAGRYGKGERIIMPLAEDGINGDGIFGATFYRTEPELVGPEPPGIALAAEEVEFFALD
ncbi:MAG TPA: PAS domain-containing protein [Alphaproteobacteria bacterium]|nr:PAS domain-containing protein [Alphaproteobacteria bacterium]